jgi:hypothetical protein
VTTDHDIDADRIFNAGHGTTWQPSRTAAVLPSGAHLEYGGAGARGAVLARFAGDLLCVATRTITSHLQIASQEKWCERASSPYRVVTDRIVRFRCDCGRGFEIRPQGGLDADYRILETYREAGIGMEHALTYVRAGEIERPCEHWLPIAL